jgi:hypothetical protein
MPHLAATGKNKQWNADLDLNLGPVLSAATMTARQASKEITAPAVNNGKLKEKALLMVNCQVEFYPRASGP